MKKFLAAGLLVLSLSACAPWTLVGGKYVDSSDHFQADLPGGWRKRNLGTEFLTITRDGLSLQQIGIGRRSIEKDLPHTKRKFASGMLPQEVAELMTDDFRSNTNVGGLEVIENTPARFGGYPGFKLVYTYRTKSGLLKRGAYYGALADKWYYFCLYEAPDMYYFGLDYDLFEKVRESVRISTSSES